MSCGKCGHTSKQCTDGYLPAWERANLKEIVFGDPPQVSFVHLGSGDQDQDTAPFGYHNVPAPYQSSTPYEIIRSNSVSVGWEQQPSLASELNSMSANAFYGESSGPNKRPNMGSEIPVGPFNTSSQPTSADRPKRKGQRRVGKKTEATPLAGMIDEISGAFDKPLSVREVMKRNRVDISLMDWMAWSPSACKELKRLCTRVSRKRQAKAKAPAASNEAPPAPSSVHPNHTPQMFPATSGPFHPQFQGFGATPRPPTHTPPDTQQSNVFQPLSYYQQRHEAANTGQRNEKTSTPSEVTTAAVSEFSAPDKHIRIVSALPKTEKAFRIPCTIRLSDKIIGLERHKTQADQGSDLNVISMGLARKLNLELLSLDHVGFRGLTMRTADHKDTPLEFWVWLEVGVQ